MEEDDGHPENGVHAAKDSDRQQRLRLCVLNEIVNTERDYVRTLLFLQSVSFDVTSVCVCVCELCDRVPLSLSPKAAGEREQNTTPKSGQKSCNSGLPSLFVHMHAHGIGQLVTDTRNRRRTRTRHL